MYGWIWRHLPGNAWVRSVIALVLVLAVVYALFQYVFPWAEPLLPFGEVTVDARAPLGQEPGSERTHPRR
ncbi:hypothetical protein LUR56_31845 [Streptomyces sp. MT29]|nr:hypothetical protein [Streptomyces sp. MT29]